MTTLVSETPAPLSAAVAAVFQGEIAYCRDLLVFEDDPREATACASLTAHDTLDRAVSLFGTAFAGADRRAIVSFWSQYYFGAFTIPLAACMILLGRAPALDLDAVALVSDPERGAPKAFRYRDQASLVADDVTSLFSAAVERHMAPLIAEIARHEAVAPKLLWSNAGGYFEWIVQAFHARRHEPALAPMAARIEEAMDFFTRDTLPGGGRNPLLRPVRYVEEAGATVRRRKICCLRHMLPGIGGCGAICPVPEGRAGGG